MRKILGLLLAMVLVITPITHSFAEAKSNLIYLTLEELAAFDGKDGAKAYIAVDGNIYDVSAIPAWQAGEHNGAKAGSDISEEIAKAPHQTSKLDGLTVIGKVVNSMTMDELAKHTGKDGAKAYIAVNGLVYDVSTIAAWQNGEHNGLIAGTDASDAILNAPHGLGILEKLTVVAKIIQADDSAASSAQDESNSSLDEKPFNLFEGIKAIKNRPFEFEDYKGKNLLVSFWTTWCPYCIKEMPDFVKFKNEYPDDVEILMVHVPSDSKIEDAKKMMEEKSFTNLTLLEDDMTYAQAFGIQGFPTNFIFDKEGYLVSAGYALTYDQLLKVFQDKNLITQ